MPKRRFSGVNIVQFEQSKRRNAFKGALRAGAATQMAIKRAIAKMSEKKELESFGSLSPVAAAGSVVVLNNISQGTTNATRVGNRVNMSSVYVDCTVVPPGTGGVPGTIIDNVLICLVYDKQPDGAAAGYSTIFDLSTGCPPGIAFKNSSVYDDRFRICWQKRISFVPGAAMDQAVFREYFKIPEDIARTEFNDNSTPATVGAWYLTAGTFSASASSATSIGLTYNVKTKFTDI